MNTMRTTLVFDALRMALGQRAPGADAGSLALNHDAPRFDRQRSGGTPASAEKCR